MAEWPKIAISLVWPLKDDDYILILENNLAPG